MTSIASTIYFGSDGNAALKPRTYRSLTLIDGYKNSSSPAPNNTHRSRRDPSQERRFYVSMVIMALALGAVLMIASLLSDAALAQSQASLSELSSSTVVVQSGDSVWSIAESHPVEGYSTSQLVTWITQNNSLDGSALQPGQTISVPQAQ